MWKMVYFSALPQAHNLVQNICRLFHVLAQFLSTTNETELDYYQLKCTSCFASCQRFKTWDFSKLGNFKKCWHMNASNQSAIQKENFDICAGTSQKISCKNSIQKPNLFLVNLSIIFCPRLSEETHFHF